MKKIPEIHPYLTEDYIIDLKSNSKKEVLLELIEVLEKNPKIKNPKQFKKAVFEREKLMSTGIGYEVAIPHVRLESIDDFCIAIGRYPDGIEYESIDDQPVKVIFMIAASNNQDKEYIKLLSRLVLRLKNQDLKQQILEAKNNKEIYNIIKDTK